MNIHEINAMTPDELAAFNKTMKRRVLLNIGGFIAIKVALAAAVHFAVKAASKHI